MPQGDSTKALMRRTIRKAQCLRIKGDMQNAERAQNFVETLLRWHPELEDYVVEIEHSIPRCGGGSRRRK